MPADPFTPTELKAGAKALRRVRHVIASDGYPSIQIGTYKEDATVVLEAVAPLIAARVQDETADGIVDTIEAMEDDDRQSVMAARHACAAIARAHRTTPTEEPTDA